MKKYFNNNFNHDCYGNDDQFCLSNDIIQSNLKLWNVSIMIYIIRIKAFYIFWLLKTISLNVLSNIV